ncbi:MAG: NUDIX domain-containing protein [Gammaproteobacteria bacterium]|nr:NUDIX domain-containing protein [Gammaproteobacteria bacterium]
MPALSAGVVVVRHYPSQRRYLLLRAYRYWDFPKGLVEAHELPLQAALRELAEETGLHDADLRWGEHYRETEVYGRGKVARYYLAACEHGDVHLPVNPELGRPEHHEFRWLNHAAARELLVARLQPILAWAHALAGQ